MEDNEQTPEVQSPLQRAIIVCYFSLIFIYSVAGRVVDQLEVPWVEWLVSAIIPIPLTFIILYRSCWHPEITGPARTCSLLVLSSIILGCELIAIGVVLCAIGIMLCMGWFCLNAVTGGNHP